MAELAAGAVLPEQIVVADGQSMRVFTLIMHDPNPVHFDAGTVRSLGLGEKPINQGTLNMAYALNAVGAALGGFERLRSFRCRFLGSVYEDDRLVAGGSVEQTADEGGRSSAMCTLWVERADGGRVLEGSAIVDIG